jgi:hypothetical protein
MKTYGGVRYSSTILDLDIRCRNVVSFTPLPLHPHYPVDRRLGGPQAGLYAVKERRISLSCRESNPESSIVQPVA